MDATPKPHLKASVTEQATVQRRKNNMAGCKRIAAYQLITSLRDRLPTGTETEIYEEIVSLEHE